VGFPDVGARHVKVRDDEILSILEVTMIAYFILEIHLFFSLFFLLGGNIVVLHRVVLDRIVINSVLLY
jgi:hypothetical protein